MTREEAINEIKSWDFLEGKEIEAIHTLIPELAESEDERIRTRLSEYFRGFLEGNEYCYEDGGYVRWEGLDVKSILAWLEKQKELFESGRGLYYYDGEKTTYCGYPATEENPYDFAMSQQEKQKEQKPWRVGANAYFTPEQKPAEWSEEDELKMNALLNYLDPNTGGTKYSSCAQLTEWYNWLKSLRPQPRQEWSEDDERNRDRALFYVRDYQKNNGVTDGSKECIDWLKYLLSNLKRRNEAAKKLCSNEWSEEDENALKYLHELIGFGYSEKFMDAQTTADMREWVNTKLKSLRPSWKPSEEQPVEGLGWRSVEESLPEMDEEVIVLKDNLGTAPIYEIAMGHIVDRNHCSDYNGWNISGVRYWMPMPKIPEEK